MGCMKSEEAALGMPDGSDTRRAERATWPDCVPHQPKKHLQKGAMVVGNVSCKGGHKEGADPSTSDHERSGVTWVA